MQKWKVNKIHNSHKIITGADRISTVRVPAGEIRVGKEKSGSPSTASLASKNSREIIENNDKVSSGKTTPRDADAAIIKVPRISSGDIASGSLSDDDDAASADPLLAGAISIPGQAARSPAETENRTVEGAGL